VFYVLFFIVFITLQQYIMLNLYILVLMQNFNENYINLDNPIQNFADLTEKFKITWALYCDETQIYFIKKNQLVELLIYLEKPLGIGFIPENQDPDTLPQLKLEKKT